MLSLAALSGLLACAPQASQPPTPTPAQRAEHFNKRVLDAVDAHRSDAISDRIVLGEGEGAWDPSPRRPDHAVTSMLWLHDVLAASYSDAATEQDQIRDALRYYDGQIAFSHRKHFIDRWLVLEPGPLAAIRACEPDQRAELALPLEGLRKKHRYGCELHEPGRTTVSLRYFSPRGTEMCADRLPEGSYVMFGVAPEKARHAQGQQHPAVVTVSAGEPLVTAPSGGSVVTMGLGDYIAQDRAARGYTLYQLDVDWQPPEIHDERSSEMLRCGS